MTATRWRIRELAVRDPGQLAGLNPERDLRANVTLLVDTKAVVIVSAIEEAARRAGITLERIDDE